MTKYISSHELIALNILQIKNYSPNECHNVLSYNLLESAINRPKQSAFGADAYDTIFKKAAALFESIVKNHIFENANKRTAFAALDIFMKYNGYELKMTFNIAIQFTLETATNELDFERLTWIIEENSIPI